MSGESEDGGSAPMTPRYIVRVADDAWRYCNMLVRVDPDGTETELFFDAMEPEDATLTRDLLPLVDELNRASSRQPPAGPPAIIASLRAEREKMRGMLREAAKIIDREVYNDQSPAGRLLERIDKLLGGDSLEE